MSENKPTGHPTPTPVPVTDHKIVPVTQAHVQNVASLGGFDWSKIWAIVQKLSPALQQIVLVILEELASHPDIATATVANSEGNPKFAIGPAECDTLAKANGIDPADLMAFFQLVGPILARLIAAFFKKTPTPAPVPAPAPVTPVVKPAAAPVNPTV